MKHLPKLLAVFLIFFISVTTFAQENYTVNGTTYVLKTEVDGPLTLLWNVIDGEYRYFAKKGDEIVELTNTRSDGRYQEEYKETLSRLTADNPVDPSKTNITLLSLRNYFNEYNKKADPDYVVKSNNVELETRLGMIGGVSNNNSTTNPENVFAPFLGAEFEVTDSDMLKRHALVLQFRYSFKTEGYDLTYSQFALSYRYKFIHSETISVFAQVKLAALTFATLAEDNVDGLLDLKKTSLNTPVGLGIGLDYKLGNGFLTFAVNDLVAPGYDTNGEFSVDLSIGYKFIL
jgi:hypothetical protein